MTRGAMAAVFGWSGGLWLQLRRAFAWDLQRVPVTAPERAHLAARGISEPLLQQYLAWRRSVLLAMCLPVALIAFLATVDNLFDDPGFWSTIGRLMVILNTLASYALPACAVASLLCWSRMKLSRRLMAGGWLFSFLVPMLLTLVPGHWLFDLHQAPAEWQPRLRGAMGILFGIIYFAAFCVYLPVFAVSIAFGVQRACLRVKSLLPASSLPGLFVVATAPVFPLLLFPFFALANQIASSPLLILGMLFLIGAPLTYLIFRRALIRPLLTRKDRFRYRAVQWFAKSQFWAGLTLLLLYSMTRVWDLPFFDSEVDDVLVHVHRKTLLGFSTASAMFQPWDWRIVRWLAIETLGRSLFTSIVVADLFLRLSHSVWRYHQEAASAVRDNQYDRVMNALNPRV
jgi:hypothetical protein